MLKCSCVRIPGETWNQAQEFQNTRSACIQFSDNWTVGMTLRRQNKRGSTQEPTQRASQQTVEVEDNCKKQCRTNDTKPNVYPTTINLHRRSGNPAHSQFKAKSSHYTYQACMQVCGRMHPVIRSSATRYLHSTVGVPRSSCWCTAVCCQPC